MRKAVVWFGALFSVGLILFVLKQDGSVPRRAVDLRPRHDASLLRVAPTRNWTNAAIRFHEASVVETQERIDAATEQKVIVQIVKTRSKYPYIRVETAFEFDAQGQAWVPQPPIEYVADQVLVQLKPGRTQQELTAAVTKVQGRVIQKYAAGDSTLVLVGLPKPTVEAVPEAIAQLSKFRDAFDIVEPHFIRRASAVPNDPRFFEQWDMQKINAPQAWDIQRGSASVVVAVTDTGIDYSHPDLASRIWTNPGEKAGNHLDDDINHYVDDVRGYNFAYDNNDPYDDMEHGTFVSGIIGAVGNNAYGTAGVCWNVRLMPIKIMDADGLLYTIDEIMGLDYARNKGAKIVNASFGGYGSTQSEYEALNRLRTAGVLFVAAAGNDHVNNDVRPVFPASYPHDNIISVAYSDSNDSLSPNSNFGAVTVDLAAPGVNVLGTIPGADYYVGSGSSFAAPHVTGVAALIKAQYPSFNYLNIKAAILNNIDFVPAMKNRSITSGRLNAYEALIQHIPLSQALESGALVWKTGGMRPWFGQRLSSFDGVDSARCGNIADGQTSWLQCTGAGPARLTFYWRVSSEADADTLRFMVDGQLQSVISGESGWQQVTYNVLSPGQHIFRWTYLKDSSISDGEDKAWLDQVSFVRDTTGPTITITAPTGTNLFASDVELDGTCSDLFGVVSLEYQLINANGAMPWQVPTTADNFANWQIQLSNLPLGTNTLRFRAVDTLGHTSVVSRTYVLLTPLTVSISGCGSVDGKYAGTSWQQAGKSLTIRATPCAGYLFSNWSGDIVSSNAALTFVMQPNLSLQANFVVNPFAPVAGFYNGLFHEPSGVLHESSGQLKLTLTDTGAFSGLIICDGATNTFSSRFDFSGHGAFIVPRKGKTALNFALELDFNDRVTGQIANGGWTADVLADRLVFNPTNNPAPFAGLYTVVFPGDSDFTLSPGGHGFATVSLNISGRVSVDGRLGDNSRILQSIGISEDGDWPFYAPLYGGRGSVLGWLKFISPPGLTNQLTSWIKPAIPTSAYYSHGFSNELAVVGSAFSVPTTNRIIDCTNALLILSGAQFTTPLTNQMVLTPSNTVLNGGPYTASMKIGRTNGTFTGTLIYPPKRTNTFQGVFLQDQNIGLGYFMGSNYVGEVRFEPVP